MKIIKVLFFLIILGTLGTIGYQNQEYFLTNMGLHIDITIFKKTFLQYTARELPNWAYWGICFVLGLLIASIRGMVKAFRLGREIKAKNLRIDKLKGEINTLKTELDVYIHDPYIKKHLANKAAEAEAAKEAANNPVAEKIEETKEEEKEAEEAKA
ncbi:MAG: hypothetical protein HUN04_05380 [Desulfobacter sp.]|nr:MAG: hypothetical protein HUN04_05380 [Desulfobacter sp.]|eukprot:Anaeramoba_ignava/a479677_22.p2 GENE.a479677_22~~a479677_22.p2  ORF type:complete len:156 (+),score=11.43 a479677_22:172-639(+)